MKTHQQRADEQDAQLAAMTAIEALGAGLVLRASPYFVCGSRSPESGTSCELEPGHDGAHIGHEQPTKVAWA